MHEVKIVPDGFFQTNLPLPEHVSDALRMIALRTAKRQIEASKEYRRLETRHVIIIIIMINNCRQKYQKVNFYLLSDTSA